MASVKRDIAENVGAVLFAGAVLVALPATILWVVTNGLLGIGMPWPAAMGWVILLMTASAVWTIVKEVASGNP